MNQAKKEKGDNGEHKERKERKRRNDEDYTRLFINVGTKRGLSVPRLLGLINDATRDKSIDIGRIDLQRNFSFFEIENDAVQKVLNAMATTTYDNEPVEVNTAASTDGESRKKGKGERRKPRDEKDEPKIKIEKKKFTGKTLDDFNFDFFNENREQRKKSRGYDFSAFDPDFEEHRNKKKKKSNDAPAKKKKKDKARTERKKPFKNRKDINRKHGRK